MTTTNHTIAHEPDELRFVIYTPEGEAVQLYEWDNLALVITHTEVPEALEGQGLGSALAKHVLQFADDQGLKIKPYCPFMEDYLHEHAPEYRHLVADDFDPDARVNKQ
jgi:uncharacterized protein